MGSILRLDILSVDGTIIWEEMKELGEIQGLCQHTDAISANTDKAGLVVGMTGGKGGGLRMFIIVVF